jgi:Ribbon-helix-helix protein, copG family
MASRYFLPHASAAEDSEKSARAKKRQGASMAKSKSVVRKKTKRPTALQRHVKSLRLPADLAQRIDRWAKAMGKDSQAEAMRHLLEIGLSAAKRKSKDG